MKIAAIIMVLVMLCTAGAAAYLYTTTNITIEKIGVIATAAADQQQSFEALKQQLESGNIYGTPYSSEIPGDASDYQFYTYTVYMNNQTFLTADMVEIQVTPMKGDVMQIGAANPVALQPRSEGRTSATILTGKDMHSIRELIVTYYLWGIPFQLKTAAGG